MTHEDSQQQDSQQQANQQQTDQQQPEDQVSVNLASLQKDQLLARRTPGQKAAAAVLTLLIGEVQTRQKQKPGTDESALILEVLQLQATSRTRELAELTRLGRPKEQAAEELAYLQWVMSRAERAQSAAQAHRASLMMSQTELEEAINALKAAGASSLGAVMGQLKAQYAGRYDGKVASETARKLLG